MKKLLSILASVLMVLAIVTPVSAEESSVSTFEQLQELFTNGGEGTLSNDIIVNNGSYSKLIISKDSNVVLDLGGHTLTIYDGVSLNVYNDSESNLKFSDGIRNEGDLTISNGTIVFSGAFTTDGMLNFGNLKLENNLEVKNTFNNYSSGHLISNLGGHVETAAVLTSESNNGILTLGGSIVMNGGSITALNNGCSGIDVFNRDYSNDGAGSNVIVNNGVIKTDAYCISTNNQLSGGETPSNVTVTDAHLSSYYSSIYWPSSGKLVLGDKDSGDGPVITSTNGSAVEICSGSLEIYGGRYVGGTEQSADDIIKTDDDLLEAFRLNSGSSGMGDAVTIISRRGKGYDSSDLSVNIYGGEFIGSKNYGVRYLDCNLAEEAEEIKQSVVFKITDGVFSGNLGAVDAKIEKSESSFIYGGTYDNTDVTQWISQDLVLDENGNVRVDNSELQDLYDKYVAEKLNKEDFTADSWTVYEKALTEAQTVLADVNAAKEDITSAKEALEKAHDALTLAPEEPVIKAPVITSGNNSSWNTNSSEGLTFVSDAEYKDFLKVLVDDKEVDNKYYTVKEGSTIVTLSKDYLSTLKEGTHTLSIVSTNGTATATFTIKAASITVPDTGITATITYLLPTTIILASGIILTIMLKKRYSR